MLPTIGRVVHVRIGGTDEDPELRPAMVVKVWSESCFNGQMWLDGRNDHRYISGVEGTCAQFTERDCEKGQAWVTSVNQGTDLGQWRWPART